jgi:hypothetical protein
MDPGCEYADTVIASEAQLQPSWTPEETLGIVDKMMALELILYRGYHAGHTVASCHYLGGVELESITDPFLNLMVRATLITMEELHQIVRASEIGFEEEMIRIPPDFFKAELDAAKVLQELGTMLSALTAESKAGNVDAGLRAMRVQLRKDLLRLVVKAGERSGQNHPAKLKTDIAAHSGCRGCGKWLLSGSMSCGGHPGAFGASRSGGSADCSCDSGAGGIGNGSRASWDSGRFDGRVCRLSGWWGDHYARGCVGSSDAIRRSAAVSI